MKIILKASKRFSSNMRENPAVLPHFSIILLSRCNKVIQGGLMGKGSFVDKVTDSEFFTVVVIGTRRHDDYNTTIDTLFTVQNNQ